MQIIYKRQIICLACPSKIDNALNLWADIGTAQAYMLSDLNLSFSSILSSVSYKLGRIPVLLIVKPVKPVKTIKLA